jgi:acyl transferase domain-containing protein
MGHSEPSSGIAGIMKAVLAIERGVIPPTIGIKTLNPNVDLKDGRLKIVTESTPWPDLPIRRASINSFGYGGSNGHVSVAHGVGDSTNIIINSVLLSLPRHSCRDTEFATRQAKNPRA